MSYVFIKVQKIPKIHQENRDFYYTVFRFKNTILRQCDIRKKGKHLTVKQNTSYTPKKNCNSYYYTGTVAKDTAKENFYIFKLSIA